jgi:hypothetical protein
MEPIKGLVLDFETADKLTVCNLKECYDRMIEECAQIEALEEIPGYKGQDLVYNKNMLKHIKAVLEYFGEYV